MSGNREPLEIERKFLISMPDRARLDAEAREKWEIRQVYLSGRPEQGSRRVRRVRCGGAEHWYYSEKIRLSDMTRIEREREITAEEAETLLEERDAAKRPIEKTRWRIPYGGRLLEVDVFPFWKRQAFCEVELPGEDADYALPPYLRVLREVSGEHRYDNNTLAREIPAEEAEEDA